MMKSSFLVLASCAALSQMLLAQRQGFPQPEAAREVTVREIPGVVASGATWTIARQGTDNADGDCTPMVRATRSAVGFRAMSDAKDAHGVLFKCEQNAIIAQTKPEAARHVAMERLHITGASAGVMQNAFEQAHCREAAQRTHIGFGLIEPLDAVGRHYGMSSGRHGKSSGLRPNSASTSSIGMPLPPRCRNQA